MLDMDEAKFPPPMPDSRARNWNCHSGVSGSCRAIPVPAAGIISRAVVKKMVLRPPAIRMKNVLGMRRVAPDRPAIAASENSSDFA